MSAPFRYSGQDCYERTEHDHCKAFTSQTGIELGHSCGIDTSVYAKDWHGVSVTTEIVTVDFAEARKARQPAQASLFAEAAE